MGPGEGAGGGGGVKRVARRAVGRGLDELVKTIELWEKRPGFWSFQDTTTSNPTFECSGRLLVVSTGLNMMSCGQVLCCEAH